MNQTNSVLFRKERFWGLVTASLAVIVLMFVVTSQYANAATGVSSESIDDTIANTAADIVVSSVPVAVIGWDVTDTDSGGDDDLFSVDVTFVSSSGFQNTDLATLDATSASGVALYADSGATEGVFDSTDALVVLTGAPTWTDLVATLLVDITDATAVVSGTVDTDYDFFVVIRTSGTSVDTNAFTAGIAAGGDITYAAAGAVAGTVTTTTPVLTVDSDAPTFSSSATVDADNDGKIDEVVLAFSESIDDGTASVTATVAGYVVSTYDTGDSANDNKWNTLFTEGGSSDTSATPSVQVTGGTIRDRALGGVAVGTSGGNKYAGNTATFPTVAAAATDMAQPVLTAVVFNQASGFNTVAFTYSETIEITGGDSIASSNGLGELKDTPASVEGFGTFAAGTIVTNAEASNTISGDGTATITVAFNNQSGDFYWVAGTALSGNVTPLAHASVLDGNGNQVNTAGAVVAPTTTSAWDVTQPTVAIAVSDADGDGKIETATLTFTEAVLDNNITDADAALGATGTTTGAFATGTANDTVTVFTRTDDAAVDTDLTEGDFVYTGATTHITDLAGNTLNTGTDGTIVTGDVTETDEADPIVVSVTKSSDAGNILTFLYSEVVNVTNGASTSSSGDMTTAGTIAGFGSFATTGDATVPTTMNTISGDNSASIVIALATQTAGYITTVASPGTEVDGAFTPVASAAVVDDAGNQVATTATADTAGDATWDLTRPTITSVTIDDASGNNGKIDSAAIIFSESMLDASFTAGDGSFNDGTDTDTTTFSTTVGADADANDDRVTFAATDDAGNSIDVNTSAETTDFLYSGATTLIVDRSRNLVDTTTDGTIVDADVTQTDSADPILVSITKSSSSSLNRLTLVYSEAVTISSGNGASTADVADYTVAGTLDAFGTFATAGDAAVNAATASTVGGSGTATITIDLAAQSTGYLVTASTTEPSGVFTPAADSDVVDAAANTVNTSNAPTTAGGSTWDLTKPGATITVSDADNDGEIETATLVFSEAIRDNSITNADATLGTDGTETGTFATGTANDATTVFSRTDDNTANSTGLGTHTDFVYTGATTLIRDSAGNLYNGAVDGAIASGDETEVDGANPLISSVTKTTSGGYNVIQLAYTESVTLATGDGASESGQATYATAGTLTSFGSFATTGNASVTEVTGNTIAGSGTATITISLAGQTGGYFASGSSTEPSGFFTSVASANLTDGTNQVVSSAVASASGTAWDLTQPTLTSVTISDASGNNGKVDRAVIVFSEAMRDANFTDADALMEGTVAGTFTTGTANDTTTTFNVTDDTAVSVDTSAEAVDFTYDNSTTSITDFAGNLLNTATDGVIADGDVTQTDSANPILISITKSSSSSLNRLTLVYSEAVTISSGDGASTADVADYTVAGTLDAFGSFATAGDTAVNVATASTVGGSGTATITIDLAAQSTGYLVTASTTEPSGVFTPVADSDVVDAAANTVNTNNAPTTAGGSTWDLTKPGVTITVSDADNDGEIETATLVFSEAIRDNSITDADATLGTDGTETGTFATGTANDATTVFSRTDDNTADDTDLGAHTDFIYTGATTLIRDSAGNLYDGTTDGAIASGDETEVDGAVPHATSAVTSDEDSDGKIDRVTITFSEDLSGTFSSADFTAGVYTVADSTESSAGVVAVTLTEGASYDTGTTPAIAVVAGGFTDAAAAPNTVLGHSVSSTDGAAPIIVSASPTQGGVLIPATANFTMTFSEAMETFSDTLGAVDTSIATSSGTVNLTTASTVITADPQGSSFSPGLTITVTLYGAADQLEDAAGVDFNPNGTVFGNIDAADDTTFTFTTQNPSSGGGGGGGGGGASTVSVTADAVTVTSPNGGEVLTGGAQADLTWTSTGNVNNVNLYYSVDGGSAFGLIAAGTANDGSYTWNVPNTATGQALVKIVGRDSGGATLATDQSNATFTIGVDSALPVEAAPTGSGEVSAPAGSMSRVDAEASLPESIDVDYLVKVADDGDATTDYDTTVYYIGLDAKRHPFVNGQVYFSWYENFDMVRTIDGSVLTQIALGTPVLTRPGTMMVKIQSDPRTFAVEPGDYTIRWVPSEEVAVALYGNAWNTRIMDIEPTYWSRFTMGSDMTADLHPAGSVIKDADGTKYYFDGVNKRAFATDEAFTANMFQNKFVIDQPASTGWASTTAGSAIVGFEDTLFSLQR